MGTRANIVLKSGDETPLWFYRQSDGYPEGALPTLLTFMDWLKSGRIRDCIGQAAGWLVILGHAEYAGRDYGPKQLEPANPPNGFCWKVGSIEPTNWGQHGDIEFLYTIDMDKGTLICEEVGGGYDDKPITLKRVPLKKHIEKIRNPKKD